MGKIVNMIGGSHLNPSSQKEENTYVGHIVSRVNLMLHAVCL